MKMRKKNILHFIVLMILASCIDPYNPPIIDNDLQLVVVDGSIDGINSARVRLTYTRSLASEEPSPAITNAVVSIADELGNTTSLSSEGNGNYSTVIGSFVPGTRYRLDFQINGKQYQSELVPFKETPEIDSLNYKTDADELTVRVFTHDDSRNSRFYKWGYNETWEYQSPYVASYVVEGGSVRQLGGDEIKASCWEDERHRKIIIGTSNRLSTDIISDFPVIAVPRTSIKLTRRYSALVTQQSLTEEAYNYWLNVQKNSENLGGLFDPLPGEVNGNVFCVSRPDEKVIGLFYASTKTQKRIFIERDQLIGYSTYAPPACKLDTLLATQIPGSDDRDDLLYAIFQQGGPPVLIGFAFSNEKQCYDCLWYGGTTTKPVFW